jgi:hypothetical protein
MSEIEVRSRLTSLLEVLEHKRAPSRKSACPVSTTLAAITRLQSEIVAALEALPPPAGNGATPKPSQQKPREGVAALAEDPLEGGALSPSPPELGSSRTYLALRYPGRSGPVAMWRHRASRPP